MVQNSLGLLAASVFVIVLVPVGAFIPSTTSSECKRTHHGQKSSNDRGYTMRADRPSRTYPALSFININIPEDTKSRSKKRAVRSHVAYYQHHKDDEMDKVDGSGARIIGSGRRRRRIKRVSQPRSHPVLSNASSSSPLRSTSTIGSSVSVKSKSDLMWSLPVHNSSLALDNISSGLRIDPFKTYPIPWKEEYTPILDFYISNICVDVPQIAQEGKKFLLRTLWFPSIIESPKAFYAAMSLGCAIYLSNHRSATCKRTLLDLRQNAISSINMSLSDPKQRCDDHTIAAVFCMCTLESLFGDSQAYQIHISGLARMVGLRGGLDNLALDGLMKRMILWLDYNHAKRHGSQLHFGQSIEVSMRPSPFNYEQLESPVSLVLDE